MVFKSSKNLLLPDKFFNNTEKAFKSPYGKAYMLVERLPAKDGTFDYSRCGTKQAASKIGRRIF